MASVFGHAAVGLTLGTACRPAAAPARFWVLGALCAVLPDIDVVTLPLGLPAGHPLAHRGLTHSLPFAFAVGVIVAALFFRDAPSRRTRWRLAGYFALATASHGVLDAMTNGGSGVAFFAPIDDARLFLPWRPILVSPIGIRRFAGAWGLAVLAGELRWILLPCAAFAASAWAIRRAVRGRPRRREEPGRRPR